MIKFAAAGFMCIDWYPQFEGTSRSYVTGNGVDVLFNLIDMRGDIEPSVVAAISDDELGKWAVREFEKRNFDMKYLDIVPGGATTTYEILLKNGDRFHNHVERGIFENYEFSDEAVEFLCGCDCMHTDFTGHLIERLPQIHAAGTKIFFDFSKKSLIHPDTDKVLPYIECGLASFEDDEEGAVGFLKRGTALGAKLLIATFGEKGSLVYDGKEFTRGGIVPVTNLVNTVGAGDSFFAGFIARYLDGAPIPECIQSGAARSAAVIQTWKPYLE